MNTEQKYLIRLTAAYLNGERLSLEAGINYAALINNAFRHNLFGVVFCALEKADNAREVIGAEKFKRLQKLFTDSIYNSELFLNIYHTAAVSLKTAGVRFVPFKDTIIELLPCSRNTRNGRFRPSDRPRAQRGGGRACIF